MNKLDPETEDFRSISRPFQNDIFPPKSDRNTLYLSQLGNEISEETMEIGATLINNFAIKNTFRGIYTSSSDLNGFPFASPIILRKSKQPTISQLEEYSEKFNWCAWDSNIA